MEDEKRLGKRERQKDRAAVSKGNKYMYEWGKSKETERNGTKKTT